MADALAAARAGGVVRCVEFGPGATLAAAVRRLARDEVTVGEFGIDGGRGIGC